MIINIISYISLGNPVKEAGQGDAMSDLIDQIKKGGIQLKQTRRFALGGTYYKKPAEPEPMQTIKIKKKPDNAVQEMKSILAGMKKTKGRVRPSAISQMRQEEKEEEEEEAAKLEREAEAARQEKEEKVQRRRRERNSGSGKTKKKSASKMGESKHEGNENDESIERKENSEERSTDNKEDVCIASATITLSQDNDFNEENDDDLPDFSVGDDDSSEVQYQNNEDNSRQTSREITPAEFRSDDREETNDTIDDAFEKLANDEDDDDDDRRQSKRSITTASIVLENNSGREES